MRQYAIPQLTQRATENRSTYCALQTRRRLLAFAFELTDSAFSNRWTEL